jgi:hypothetical protein
MMNQLLSNTESAAKALVERVEKYNIGNIQGEEVEKFTSQVASAINRLKQIGNLPPYMTTTLLTIMQTSSVDEFNKVFAAIEVQKTLDDLNQSSNMYVKCFNYTADDILSVAEAQYLKLFEKGPWTGATTKVQYSAFAAQQWTNAKFLPCHNCGKPGCWVEIFPNPRDDEKIKLNRQLFMNKKAGGGGEGSGAQKTNTKNKWRKPENGEKVKRQIDDKQMYYHYRSGKWKVVDKTPAQIAAAKKARVANIAAAALVDPAPEGAQAAVMTAALPLPTATPSQDKLKAANLSKLVFEQLNLVMRAEFDCQLSTWIWKQTTDWMWSFLKATLMPGLIGGIGVRYLYHTLFPYLPPFSVRRTRCYHTRRRMDQRRVRSNICQGNDTKTKDSADW